MHGQLQAPVALYSEKNTPNILDTKLCGPHSRYGGSWEELSPCPCRESKASRQFLGLPIYGLTYPGH
jgi:hypothetical protein